MNGLSIKDRLDSVRNRVERAALSCARRAADITLIAVTKTYPAESAQELVACGVTNLGENRVQELCSKAPLVSANPTWHLIGHLQRNKINRALEHTHWVHSVDSVRLAQALGRQAELLGITVNCLIEVNLTSDTTKTGATANDLSAIVDTVAQSPSLALKGLMTIGPLGGDESQVRRCFAQVRELSGQLGTLCAHPELSMGMSQDFEWAIQEGATMIRVGSVLLGERTGAQTHA